MNQYIEDTERAEDSQENLINIQQYYGIYKKSIPHISGFKKCAISATISDIEENLPGLPPENGIHKN